MNALSPHVTAARLRSLASEKFALDPGSLPPRSRLGEDFARDIIDAADFLLDVEAEWAVTIPEEEVGFTPTLQQLSDYLVAHSPGRGKPWRQTLRSTVEYLMQPHRS